MGLMKRVVAPPRRTCTLTPAHRRSAWRWGILGLAVGAAGLVGATELLDAATPRAVFMRLQPGYLILARWQRERREPVEARMVALRVEVSERTYAIREADATACISWTHPELNPLIVALMKCEKEMAALQTRERATRTAGR